MVGRTASRQVHLAARPDGPPSRAHFRMAEVALPPLAEGEVLVENLYMSVDPYMRRSMDAVARDLPPWPIGAALNGPSVGRVVASRNACFAEGDVVESMSGWQSHFVSQGEAFVPYLSADNALAKRRVGGDVDASDWLGLLGIASQTGYFAMQCAVQTSPGDTVVVSSGAGTVGSVACQVARNTGLRVVTSAGSADKRRWLEDMAGVVAALDYRAPDFAQQLRGACPGGIDLVLENASPEHLAACLPLMNEGGTVLIAGLIGLYSSGGAARLDNFEQVLERYLTIRAFAFMDHLDHYDAFVGEMVAWRGDGRMDLRTTVYDGLEHAPGALAALFDGSAAGKLLVRIAD